MKNCVNIAAFMVGLGVGSAQATPFTETSKSGLNVVNSGISAIGGLVFDAVGLSGVHLVTQLSASDLLSGSVTTYPVLLGSFSGVTAPMLNAMGGGLSSVSVRLTMFDGDNGLGNFDYRQYELLLDGWLLGNLSDVETEATDAAGQTALGSRGLGFRSDLLDTGWLFSTNADLMSKLFTSMIDGELNVEFNDLNGGVSRFGFTEGLSTGFQLWGLPPILVSPVPEPSVAWLLGIGLMGLLGVRRGKRV